MEYQECGIGIVEEKGVVCGNFGFEQMTLDTMMECVARRLLRPAPGQQLPGSLLRGGNYPVHSLEAEEDRLVYDKDIEEEK